MGRYRRSAAPFVRSAIRRAVVCVLAVAVPAASAPIRARAARPARAGESSARSWIASSALAPLLSTGATIDPRSTHTSPTRPPEVGRNPRHLATAPPDGSDVRITSPASDGFLDTQTRTSVAASGDRVLVGFDDDSGGGSDGLPPASLAGYAASADGGRTWVQGKIAAPDGRTNGGSGSVAFGLDGSAYYASITTPDDPAQRRGVAVAVSADGGLTFGAPVTVGEAPAGGFVDRPFVVFDADPASARRGTCYVLWTSIASPADGGDVWIACARSLDGGATFEAPVAVTPPHDTELLLRPVATVLPSGDLCVLFLDYGRDLFGDPSDGGPRVVAIRSTDGGLSFGPLRTVASVRLVSRATGGGRLDIFSFPSVASDRSGGVHVVFAGTSAAAGPDVSDIYYVASPDGGATFGAPVRLNDDDTITTQAAPSVAVADDGTVGVKWWDRRNDPAHDSLTDVYMTTRPPGAAAFGPNVRVTRESWTFAATDARLRHGESDGLAASGDAFLLAWGDERSGDADVYFSRVPTRPTAIGDVVLAPRSLAVFAAAGHEATTVVDVRTSLPSGSRVVLSATSDEPRVTVSLDRDRVGDGEAATLTIRPSASTPVGTYRVRLTASAGGVTRATSVRVTVLGEERSGSLPLDLSDSRGTTFASRAVAVGHDGALHVAFQDDTETANTVEYSVRYRRSSDGGASFDRDVVVSPPSTTKTGVRVVVGARGEVYVLWVEFAGTPARTSQLLVSVSRDDGATFDPPIGLTDPALLVANGDNLDARPTPDGGVAVAYVSFASSGAPPALYLVRFDAGVTAPPTPIRISKPYEGVNGFSRFSVATDEEGDVFVAYQGLVRRHHLWIRLATVDARGKVRVESIRPEAAGVDLVDFGADVAVDDAGTLFLALTRFDAETPGATPEFALRARRKGERDFATVFSSRDVSSQAVSARVAAGRDGRVYVTWETAPVVDPHPEPSLLVAESRDGGRTFSPPTVVFTGDRNTTLLGTDVGPDGRAFTSWVAEPEANFEIYGCWSAAAPD